MTTRPAFLFDLDGTLAHTLPDIAASLNFVRTQRGLDELPHDSVRSMIGDGARMLLQRALRDALPEDDEQRRLALEGAFAEFWQHHREQCVRLAAAFPGVREHLTALRRRGHPLAVVTNKPERFATAVVRHLELDALFAVVVGGDTLAQKKPDPAPLRHALIQLGSASDGATIVGDGLPDLRAGKALGIRTIACLFGYGDPNELRAEGADVYWRAFAVPVSETA